MCATPLEKERHRQQSEKLEPVVTLHSLVLDPQPPHMERVEGGEYREPPFINCNEDEAAGI